MKQYKKICIASLACDGADDHELQENIGGTSGIGYRAQRSLPRKVGCWAVSPVFIMTCAVCGERKGFRCRRWVERMRRWRAPAPRSPDFFTYNPMNSADETNGWWNNAYQDINTLNGVLVLCEEPATGYHRQSMRRTGAFPAGILVLLPGDQFWRRTAAHYLYHGVRAPRIRVSPWPRCTIRS